VLHFKLRVLDLFDLFMKINSTHPLFVAAIEPILDLLHSTSTSRDSLLLHNKLASIVKSRIVHNKEILSLARQEDKTACLQVLEMILNTCRKTNDAHGTFGGICFSLVRSLVHPSNNAEVAAAQEPPKKKKKQKSIQKDSSLPVKLVSIFCLLLRPAFLPVANFLVYRIFESRLLICLQAPFHIG
jgi:hypothetical protein